MDFVTYDIETTYGSSNGRVGNRWDDSFGLCSVGWKFGQGGYYDAYTVTKNDENIRVGLRPGGRRLPFPDLSNVSYLVGHNIKFDLIWYWDHPILREFLKRGGKIWDTMYAEYLLSGQFYNFHNKVPGMGLSLREVAKRRGCQFQKLDVVAALWDDGVRTEDIESNILLEYQKYDVLTTEEIFLAQVKQAREQDQMTQIQQRMEGLLATTEMEFNGMFIDQELAAIQQKDLEENILELEEQMDANIPELPEGCEFSWGSWKKVSALLFGGAIKYKGREYVLDEFGAKTYYQTKVRQPVLDTDGNKQYFKSGKNKGALKTKLVTVPDLERGPKTRQCDMYHVLPGICEPLPKWEKESSPGYYSTDKDTMEYLTNKGVKLANLITKRGKMSKDLGTYYKRYHKGKWTGMLTNIQPDGCVHGQLNHTVTVTGRLSSSQPNLQNIPKEGKSLIKKTFVSRWQKGKVVDGEVCTEDGVVAELDYSQLEVVCKGVLSGDKALLQALLDGVDEHCEWLAFVEGLPYEEVFDLCKVQKIPAWQNKRQNIKSVTFSEKYGAGVSHMAAETGIHADIIKQAIERRKLKYPDMYKFDEIVEAEVNKTRAVTTLRTEQGYQRAIGYYRSCTGTVYHFLEGESLQWQQDKGIMTAFQPTCMKNYPSQGLGGEIMQTESGRVFRALIRNDLTDRIKLINTVHDSIYIDFKTEKLAKKYLPLIAGLLEDVSDYMNSLYPDVAWNTPFPVDADYGANIMEANNTIKERDKSWIQ